MHRGGNGLYLPVELSIETVEHDARQTYRATYLASLVTTSRPNKNTYDSDTRPYNETLRTSAKQVMYR